MGGKHVVNCPFFDAETVFEHRSQQFGQLQQQQPLTT
jgi:hypothetical protein